MTSISIKLAKKYEDNNYINIYELLKSGYKNLKDYHYYENSILNSLDNNDREYILNRQYKRSISKDNPFFLDDE